VSVAQHRRACKMWERIYANQGQFSTGQSAFLMKSHACAGSHVVVRDNIFVPCIAFFISENSYTDDMRQMLQRVLEYASGWSPGVFSGIYRQLGLTMSRRTDEWRAAFARYVALGLPLNAAVTAYSKVVVDAGDQAQPLTLSVCTWNMHGSMSCGTDSTPDDRIQQQLGVLRDGLMRPSVLCLQEVSTGMLQQLEQQLGYIVLVRDLVYAEVEQVQMPDDEFHAAAAAAGSHSARKRARTNINAAPLTCADITDQISRGELQPSFCGFNVIAVRSDLVQPTASRAAFLQAHAEESVQLRTYDTRVHNDAQVAERRMLSSVLLSVHGCIGESTPRSLRVRCTHLDSQPGVVGMDKRYADASLIHQQLAKDAQQHVASVLCGDLNACSEWDYSPGEQYMLLAFSGLAAEASMNPWGALEKLEQKVTDCFALAQQARPKISCWACTRVDHILLNTHAAHAWRVQRAAMYHTMASDHLPVICWMRASA
jgi:endonuclease/exonuclease/phosphatase family metal-dependent hydrolase